MEVDRIYTIAVEPSGSLWIGGYRDPMFTQVSMFAGGQDYFLTDNSQWLDASQWRATYDITTFVPRGVYTITISNAKGTDGIAIPTDTRFNFTVDYAGEISDFTPPNPPLVLAGGKLGDPSTVESMWAATEPDSAIARYRYAIGSIQGATDIVYWTYIAGTSMTRSGLVFEAGHRYWVTVQAQNTSGLWSAKAYCSFVAGQPMNRVFLPIMRR